MHKNIEHHNDISHLYSLIIRPILNAYTAIFLIAYILLTCFLAHSDKALYADNVGAENTLNDDAYNEETREEDPNYANKKESIENENENLDEGQDGNRNEDALSKMIHKSIDKMMNQFVACLNLRSGYYLKNFGNFYIANNAKIYIQTDADLDQDKKRERKNYALNREEFIRYISNISLNPDQYSIHITSKEIRSQKGRSSIFIGILNTIEETQVDINAGKKNKKIGKGHETMHSKRAHKSAKGEKSKSGAHKSKKDIRYGEVAAKWEFTIRVTNGIIIERIVINENILISRSKE